MSSASIASYFPWSRVVIAGQSVSAEAALRRLLEAGSRWLAVEWLPACAPELNPTEQVWNHTKYGDLANYIPEDIDALCREVERSIGAKRSLSGPASLVFQPCRTSPVNRLINYARVNNTRHSNGRSH